MCLHNSSIRGRVHKLRVALHRDLSPDTTHQLISLKTPIPSTSQISELKVTVSEGHCFRQRTNNNSSDQKTRSTITAAMHVKQLPSDVILVVMQYLTAYDLAALSQTCIYMYDLVGTAKMTALLPLERSLTTDHTGQ